jgi:cell shape-determining protein MreC
MAIVRKENRQLTVQDDVVESYLAEGYDQIDLEGNVVKRATGGRMVPLAEFNKVLEALEAADVEKLEQKIKDQQEEIKVLENENDRLTKQLRNNQQNTKR